MEFNAHRGSRARNAIAATAVSALVVLGSFETPAGAQTYLPLAVGNQWSYENDFGLRERQRVAGTIELFGREVFVMRYEQSDVNEGLENYWYVDDAGDLYACGFHRTIEGWGKAYDPPILWLDGPLALGKSWSTETTAYDYPALEHPGALGLGLYVAGYGPVEVPAGVFDSFAIAQFVPRGTPAPSAADELAQAGVGIDGARRATSLGFVGPTYYAAGVGVVVYETYALSSPPVPALAASWGRLKQLYR